MKQMFFYNAVKLWNNVGNNDLVRPSDVKKFKRNYFDLSHIVYKFMLDSFNEMDRIF